MSFNAMLPRNSEHHKQTIYFLMKFLVLSTLITLPVSSKGYSTQLQAEYKGGTRHVGYLNVLAPVWQKPQHLLYLDIIGMSTSKSAKEINMGFGYREIISVNSIPYTAGSYLFYDVRNTQSSNIVQQIAGGLELLGAKGEIRINGYVPIGKTSFTLRDDRANSGRKNIYSSKKYKIEQVMGGFDFEVGRKIPKVPVNAYLGFYRFCLCRRHMKQEGFKARLEYKPLYWLITGGEYSYPVDKKQKRSWYLNIGIRFNLLSGSTEMPSPFSTESKMNQPPIRDLDIITENKNFVIAEE